MSDLPQAILFDLDDTIIDDSAGADSGWRTALQDHEAALTGIPIAGVFAAVQEVRAWFWSDAGRHRSGRADLRATSAWVVGQALARFGIDDPALSQRIANRYRDIRDASRSLLPGAIETLERVRGLGIAAALLTNGSAESQRAKIEQFNLARLFDYICIEGEFGCGKPDESVYTSALRALGCEPGTAWMAGDNLEWDVAAPMRLGVSGIWVDRFETGLPATSPVRPDRIVLGIRELL